ncbi:hypothetical protein DFJ77DRAFT_467668 [Powellomyces hirtus]|nr:hypothetical protein DFJ77DRAFT_467668 [Powellomyces hirtus]
MEPEMSVDEPEDGEWEDGEEPKDSLPEQQEDLNADSFQEPVKKKSAQAVHSSLHVDEWDDSSLIEAWDAAVREFQTYHSDQPATGGSKKRKKRQTKQPEARQRTTSMEEAKGNNHAYSPIPPQPPVTEHEPQYDDFAMHDAPEAFAQRAGGPSGLNHRKCVSCGEAPVETHHVPQSAAEPDLSMAPPLPEDEDLANVMMSWYYAGYYSGMYAAKMRGQTHQTYHPPE